METRSHNSGVLTASAMIVVGGGFVVLGGLVAAVTAPLGIERGSWLAAYLVLVCGVAQFAIGTVQAGQTGIKETMSPRWAWVQLLSLNLGNAAVITGTLIREPLVVDAGVVFLVVAFGIAAYAVRPWGSPSVTAVAGVPLASAAGRFLLWGYRVFLLLLVVSLPVGSVLAHLRSN